MDLSKLSESEALNVEATTKHLGYSADLLHDLEKLYQVLPALLKSPGGDIATSDELLAFLTILHESRMCEVLLTKSVLSAMRMYQADAFTHLRRAIECSAFAARMGKHHELARVWAEGTRGEDAKYKEYRKAFTSRDVYPDEKHPDHDPILMQLKDAFDLCSKTIHGSPLGMAGHFATVTKQQKADGRWHINFFDMPPDSFVSCFFHILGTHCLILSLFEKTIRPYVADPDAWKEKYEKEYRYAAPKVQRHLQKWLPNIAALYAARNTPKDRKVTGLKPPARS